MRVALFLLGVLLLPIAAPTAVAWRADGWLSQEEIGGNRLAQGDEFGCHGMPGRDVAKDLTVIEDCKAYLTSNINASKWGAEPLSFGIDGNIDTAMNEALLAAGFHIVGDSASVGDTEGLSIMARSGGSLEKNVASISDIQAAAVENGNVNLYWEAQIEDLNVRRDKEVVSWIEDQPFWFTTWGELYSASQPPTPLEQNETGLTLQGTDSTWSTPGTILVTIAASNITEIHRLDGNSMTELTMDDNHLKAGYRLLSNSSAVISVPPGIEVRIDWESTEGIAHLAPANFNNLTPFMAVGHHTTDLFEWSKDFVHSPIRFTWLIEPQAEIEPTWILPAIAVITILIVPVAVRWTLRHEQDADLEEQ